MGDTVHYGPILHAGRNAPVAGGEGVQSSARGSAAGSAVAPPWTARWIWLNAKNFPDHQTSPNTWYCDKARAAHAHTVALFRREVNLPFAPRAVKARISADVKYRLFINGQLAGRGPTEVGGDYGDREAATRWFYESYDLTPLFRKGPNAIAVEVALQGNVQADYSTGRGGLLFEAEITLANGRRSRLRSDGSWRGTRSAVNGAPDLFYLACEPVGWSEPGFRDAAWPKASVLKPGVARRWHLVARDIPPLMEATIRAQRIVTPFPEISRRIRQPKGMMSGAHPTTILPGAPVTFWLDFGKEIAGYAQFTVRGIENARMTVGYEEVPGRTHRAETYVLRDGLQRFECPRLEGFQYLKITLDRLDGPVEIHDARCSFSSFPVRYRGVFECSDKSLDRIWKVGRWTTQLCMQSYHLDSPIHQEPLGCTGDYRIETLVSYYAFGEGRLARLDLQRTAWQLERKNGIMFHTSYSLLWVRMLAEYYQYTGDLSLPRELMPVVAALLKRFESYRGPGGLLTGAPNYMFMDWVASGPFALHHPPCSIGQGYLSAFYVDALRDAAALARALGDEARAAEFEGRAGAVTKAFQRELWTPRRGLYCDGRPHRGSTPPHDWLPPDPDKIFYSAHTNALAVACEIAPKERRAEILLRALEDTSLPPMQPYFMHYLFDALEISGLYNRLWPRLVRRWNRLLEEHESSWKENWDWGDYSHAWTSTPTYQLSARVLGVRPLAPGFARVSVKPHPGRLAWACGRVPTPRGDVSASWRRNGRRFSMEVELPSGVAGVLSLPRLGISNPAVKVDGRRKLHSLQADAHFITLPVGPGKHSLTLSGAAER